MSDKQYITDTDCTVGDHLLPDQQPYATLRTSKIFLSSWALGMGKRRHHLRYSLEPSSSICIKTVAFSYSQHLQGVWFLVFLVAVC